MLTLSLAAVLLGCHPPEEPPVDTSEPAMEELFSFAIVADPHIVNSPLYEERLVAALDWIDTHAAERQIDLVFALGDVAWGAGLDVAPALFDSLSVPVVPLIGDNEVHGGSEERFDQAFAPRFEALAGQLDNWERAPTPVTGPSGDLWLQNAAFEHDGVRFVLLDWAVRDVSGPLGEVGTLHDYESGSLPWLRDHLGGLSETPDESVVLVSHIPMRAGLFNVQQMDALSEVITPLADKIYGDFAGHMHVTLDEDFPELGYGVFITQDTHSDPPALRVVTVSGNGARFEYHHEVVEL